MAALTRDLFVQRYNVAASRAKDQMWLFHSVSLGNLGNPEDMRFQLLDYCSGVINRRSTGEDRGLSGVLPEDRVVDPFDSLFEQRLANRLIERGYPVIPNYVVAQHKLDLVVVGAKSRLAIACDGGSWARTGRLRAGAGQPARPRMVRLAVLPGPRVGLLSRRVGRAERAPGDVAGAGHPSGRPAVHNGSGAAVAVPAEIISPERMVRNGWSWSRSRCSPRPGPPR